MKLIVHSFIARDFDSPRICDTGWSFRFSEIELSNEEFLILKLKYNLLVYSNQSCYIKNSNNEYDYAMEDAAIDFLLNECGQK